MLSIVYCLATGHDSRPPVIHSTPAFHTAEIVCSYCGVPCSFVPSFQTVSRVAPRPVLVYPSLVVGPMTARARRPNVETVALFFALGTTVLAPVTKNSDAACCLCPIRSLVLLCRDRKCSSKSCWARDCWRTFSPSSRQVETGNWDQSGALSSACRLRRKSLGRFCRATTGWPAFCCVVSEVGSLFASWSHTSNPNRIYFDVGLRAGLITKHGLVRQSPTNSLANEARTDFLCTSSANPCVSRNSTMSQ